jgi:GT2 family glycosyltransferase
MVNNKLAIIIPAFSGHKQIKHCLESLYSSHYSDFHAVIVDHGVTDAITRRVNDVFPQTTCKRGSPELWWSGASNLGIRYALESGSKWIMLLNHDCYVHPDTIGTLLKYIENKPNAVIAPAQHFLRSRRDIVGTTSCFLLGFPTLIPPPAWYRLRHSTALVPVSLIAGGRGVVIAADTFHRVGYLDEEHLPHYYADHDFYFRCRKAGLRLLVCREARVDIDDAMTTSADLDTGLSLTQFTTSLKDRDSHRNIRDLQVLFSRYYPIPGLGPLGVALNTMRFFFMYLVKTLVRTINRGRKPG